MAIQFHCCLILLNYVLLAYVSFFSGLLSLVDLILIWLATKTVLDRPLVMVIVQILFPDYFRSLAVFKSILVCLDVLYIIQLYFFYFFLQVLNFVSFLFQLKLWPHLIQATLSSCMLTVLG